MGYPSFNTGDVLAAADMNAVGMWAITPSSVTNSTISGATVTVGNAVTTVKLNGIFSSTYASYRIVIAGIDCSAANQYLQVNFGGTNLHYGSLLYDFYQGTNTNYDRANNAAAFSICRTGTDNDMSVSFDVNNPNLPSQTTAHGTYYGGGYSGFFSGVAFTTTQYTSIEFRLTGGATMSGGTINVYGYRK